MQLKSILGGLDEFLLRLEKSLIEAKFDILPHWQLDHICYRVSTSERYQALKSDLEQVANLLIASDVNGREISTFRLSEPIRFLDRSISLLELPAPKPGANYAEGFEHIEIVIDQDFQKIQKHYSHLEFKKSGLQKVFNPELAILFGDTSVKLHHLCLESVVNLESNHEVFQILMASKVLNVLKPYHAFVAGTFPLGISTPNSDLDIICSYTDKSKFSDEINNAFSAYSDFNLDVKEDYVQSNFIIDGIAFEVYAEENSVGEQRAYRHFNLQERLLYNLGDDFRSRIVSLRNEGLKTEPAFAKALGLPGDPYQALLDLYQSSELELRNHFSS